MPGRKRKDLQLQRSLVIALLIAVGYLVWDKVWTQQQLANPDYLVELANGLQKDLDIGRHAQMVLETRALAEEELLQLQALGKKATLQLTSLRSEATALNDLLRDLRSSSEGSAIAADRKLLEQFHAATARYDLTPESLATHERSLTVLLEPVDAALASKSFDKPPAPELRTKLESLVAQIRAYVEQVEETRQKVDAIVAAAPHAAQAALDLQTALDELEREWATEQAEAAQKAAETVREEFRVKFAAQQAEQEREKLQAELENKQKVHTEKLQAEKLAAEAEARRIAEAAEEAREEEQRRIAARKRRLKEEAAEREYQAALPEIERYLSGIITPGHQQFVGGRWVYTEELKPLSYGAIKARQAMAKDGTGQFHFAGLVASKNNDRPAGVMSGHLGGQVAPAMVPDVVKAQSLLEKYADKLIEHGRLLP